MRKLLFVTTVVPWPDCSGGRQRTMMVLKQLARFYSVTALFPSGPGMDQAIQHLESYGIEPVAGLPLQPHWLSFPDALINGYPWPFAPFVEAVESDFQHLWPEHDLLWFDHLHMVPLLDKTEALTKKLVLDQHNVEGRLYRAWGALRGGLRGLAGRWAGARIEAYDRKVLERFDLLIAASGQDASWFEKAGVDPSRMAVIPNGAHRPSKIAPPVKERRVLYTGALDWQPNVDAVTRFHRQVWQRLKTRHHTPELLIAGSHPLRPLERLAAADDSVRLIADFSDPQDVYGLANIVITPTLLPGGMKIKTVEGLLHGRHVVSTRQGAEGVGACSALHVCGQISGFLPLLDELLETNTLPRIAPEKLTGLDWEEIGRQFQRTVLPRLLSLSGEGNWK